MAAALRPSTAAVEAVETAAAAVSAEAAVAIVVVAATAVVAVAIVAAVEAGASSSTHQIKFLPSARTTPPSDPGLLFLSYCTLHSQMDRCLGWGRAKPPPPEDHIPLESA